MASSRPIIRKLRKDGARALVHQGVEDLIREGLIRRYVDRNINYPQETVTVQDLINEGELTDVSQIGPVDRQVPNKQRVPDKGDIQKLSADNIVTQQCGVIRDATVLSPSGLVRTTDGRYVSDSVGPHHLAPRRISISLSKYGYEHGLSKLRTEIERRSDNSPQSQTEYALSLIPIWPNYFHWTIESLLKLYWLDCSHFDENNVTLLVPSDPSCWMVESMQMLGFNQLDITRASASTTQVDKLLLPSKIEPISQYSIWIRDCILGSSHNDTKGERIYICRRKATKRRVLNEEPLISKLRTKGFEPYILEDLSVEHQIRLFASAEMVIGPHGAGFANLIYADEPKVIELFGNKRLNTYHRLSGLLEYKYEPIYCESSGTDLIVDIPRVLEKVEKII